MKFELFVAHLKFKFNWEPFSVSGDPTLEASFNSVALTPRMDSHGPRKPLGFLSTYPYLGVFHIWNLNLLNDKRLGYTRAMWP